MFFLIPGAIAHGAALLLGYKDINIPVYYSIAFIIGFSGLSFYIYLSDYIVEKRFKARLQELKSQSLGVKLILQAKSIEELKYFLRNINLGKKEIRSVLRLLRSPPSYQANHPIYGSTLFKLDWTKTTVDEILNLLMMNLYRSYLQNSNS
ncbi:hypothetical protein [Methylomonas sp. DH-1]|uniref:hypothetical protein n=1 Tax=Methylomonas sp. (strain DH-1) TaxID=1727196 RepID=UPI000A6B742F|nr:hypothetical protein [Methylomonas sp. DH-1]